MLMKIVFNDHTGALLMLMVNGISWELDFDFTLLLHTLQKWLYINNKKFFLHQFGTIVYNISITF